MILRNQYRLIRAILTITVSVLFIVLTFRERFENAFLTTPSQPVQQIVFIKVHKSASSTLQTIFMSYGLRHDLTFVIPQRAGNYLGWPNQFHPRVVKYIGDIDFDILCYHSRYSEEMRTFMPTNSKYVTILRDPVSQLESSFKYFQEVGNVNLKNKTFGNFILNDKTKYQFGPLALRVFNPQIFDLGFSHNYMGNKVKISEYLLKLDSEFDIVMIAEYFDESLIMLRDLLHWKTEDILYLKKNVRPLDKRSDLNGSVVAEIKRWNMADIQLYSYFKRKLEAIVLDNPEYYQRELKSFRQKLYHWQDHCIDSIIPGDKVMDPRFKPFPPSAMGYKLTKYGEQDEGCVNLAMSELAFVKRIARYMENKTHQ